MNEPRMQSGRTAPETRFLFRQLPGAMLQAVSGNNNAGAYPALEERYWRGNRFVHVDNVVRAARLESLPCFTVNQPGEDETTSQTAVPTRGNVVGAEVVHGMTSRFEWCVCEPHQAHHAAGVVAANVVGNEDTHQ